MLQRLTPIMLGLVFCVSAMADSALEVIHDSGDSVPLAPYVAQIVGGADEANVMEGLRFPFRSSLKFGLLKQDGVQVFTGKWLTQPAFVLGADEQSMRWLAFNHAKLIQLNAVGVVVQAGSPVAFKALQQLASPLQVAPDTGSYLSSKLSSAGAGVFPVLVHSDGRVFQILPQRLFGTAK